MNKALSLKVIFGVAVFGVLFSGVLSYQEIFGNTAVTCPTVGQPGTVLGYPACVYGFFMYIVLAVVAFLGVRSEK